MNRGGHSISSISTARASSIVLVKMSKTEGLECFWSNLDKHPTCPHGPTLLFGKYVDGELKQFYACSACRDKNLCNFYEEKDATPTDVRKKGGKAEKKNSKTALPSYNHRRLFIRFNEVIAEPPERRAYCHRCSMLVLSAERDKHADHDMQIGLTDEQVNNPTTILKPLSNVKKEAQYLFSTKAIIDIVNMLVKAGAEQVLCIGAPRIHEYINQNFAHKISSLLMDFDGRFHDFFGPLSYCWYNLFNHHFFTEEAAQTYRDFITQNRGRNTFVVCDPPFGGRVEAMSQTIKTIVDQHEKWNSIKEEDNRLKIFFVFPYFMESILQRKSNPVGTSGGLKDLVMADYKVDYDNHPLFTGLNGRKHGSPVRIFTNISLSLLELPAEDGYKFCAKCKKWTSAENKHCKKCKACTSKDGRRYRHCKLCERCVKPTWKHCKVCERCVLEQHTCGSKPKVTGLCFTCGGSDHVGRDCSQGVVLAESSSEKLVGKRKGEINGNEIAAKKKKTSLSEKRAVEIEETQNKKTKKGKKIISTKQNEASTEFKRGSFSEKLVGKRKGEINGNEIAAKKKKTSLSEKRAVEIEETQNKKKKKGKKIISTKHNEASEEFKRGSLNTAIKLTKSKKFTESSSEKLVGKRKGEMNGDEIAAKKKKTSLSEKRAVQPWEMEETQNKKKTKVKKIISTKQNEASSEFKGGSLNTAIKLAKSKKSAESSFEKLGETNGNAAKKTSLSEKRAVPIEAQYNKKTKIKKITSTERNIGKTSEKAAINLIKTNKSTEKKSTRKKLKSKRNAT